MANSDAGEATAVEPWEGYDEASAEDLIDAAGRKRSAEKLHAAVEHERAGKDRVTVIEAFEQRLAELDDEDQDQGQGDQVKGQPGEVRDGDVTSPADRQDTSKRKSTGQVAAEETQERQAARQETNAKAEKAAAEGGVTPRPVAGTAPVYAEENRQDRVELVGHQYRDGEDVEPDPGYVFDEVDAKESSTVVDHLAVAASTEGTYVEINDNTVFFDVDLSLALNRLMAGAATALNN